MTSRFTLWWLASIIFSRDAHALQCGDRVFILGSRHKHKRGILVSQHQQSSTFLVQLVSAPRVTVEVAAHKLRQIHLSRDLSVDVMTCVASFVPMEARSVLARTSRSNQEVMIKIHKQDLQQIIHEFRDFVLRDLCFTRYGANDILRYCWKGPQLRVPCYPIGSLFEESMFEDLISEIRKDFHWKRCCPMFRGQFAWSNQSNVSYSNQTYIASTYPLTSSVCTNSSRFAVQLYLFENGRMKNLYIHLEQWMYNLEVWCGHIIDIAAEYSSELNNFHLENSFKRRAEQCIKYPANKQAKSHCESTLL